MNIAEKFIVKTSEDMNDHFDAKNIFFLILLLVLQSCNTNNNKDLDRDSLDIPFENSEWTYFNILSDEIVEKKGKFLNGRKQGNWEYTISNEKKKKISWQEYVNESLTLIFPQDWFVSDENKFSFFANSDTSALIVVMKSDLNEDNLLQYFSNFYEVVKTDTTEKLVKAEANSLTKQNGERLLVYDFMYENDLEIWINLGLFFIHKDQVYDIALRMLKTSDFDIFWSKIFFTEFINNVFIEEKRVVISASEYDRIEMIDLN